MTLILYIIIFSAVCFWRKRNLSGAYLKEKRHTDGREYLESLEKTNKGRSVKPTLGLSIGNVPPFAIRREKAYHRFLKSMGLAEEISTGDSAVDDHLFFVTETPEDFHAVISKPNVLTSIHKLFSAYRVKDLRCFSGKIWVTCQRLDRDEYTPAYATERLELLGTIANAAELAAENTPPTTNFITKPRIAAFFMIVHAALVTLGVCGIFPLLIESAEVIKTSELIYFGVTLSLLLMSGWLFCIFISLGKSSWLPMVAADFVIMGMAGLFLSTTLTVREVNMQFDTKRPVIFTKTVVAKQCELTCSERYGKKRRTSSYLLTEEQCAAGARPATLDVYRGRDRKCSNTYDFEYTLALEPWLPGQKDNFEFKAYESVYDATKRGDKMIIPSRSGALGIEWVDTDDIAPAK